MAEERTPYVFYALMGLIGLFVVGIGGWWHYDEEPPLPPAPPPEKKPEFNQLNMQMRFSADVYKSILAEDAKKFGVNATLEAVQGPFTYKKEFEGPKKLGLKDTLETEHLTISTKSERQSMGGGQGVGVDQFILTIQNKSVSYLAYRVETDVADEKPCRSAGLIPHNAIALRPDESVSRIECATSRGFYVTLRKVEVIELPALSYYYISRLQPTTALYSERTSQGHQPPSGKLCEMVPWQEIREGAEANAVAWDDVIDFYARHNCDEYSFFKGYKRRTEPGGPLPAVPNKSAGDGQAKPTGVDQAKKVE